MNIDTYNNKDHQNLQQECLTMHINIYRTSMKNTVDFS